MNIISNIEQVIEKLKTLLPDYLIAMNIIKDKHDKFSCIFPDHNDSNPSCGLVPSSDFTYGNCFGCSRTFNIFKAANLLEAMPLEGSEFYSKTIPHLAKMFNINLTYKEPSEEEKNRNRVLKIYKDVKDYIIKDYINNKSVASILIKRGWTKFIIEKIGVGAISSRTKFMYKMNELGYNEDDLIDAGIIGEKNSRIDDIFQSNSIIFSLNNSKGQPIAFAARKIDGADVGVSKYINSASSKQYPDLFKKGEYLYGTDLLEDKTKPVYIVEGYADVITMKRYGIENVVGVCGKYVRSEQLKILLNLGFRNIILALDNDTAGIDGTNKAVEMLSHRNDIYASILLWPENTDNTDPDNFIRANGIRKFNALRKESLLMYLLDTKTETSDVNEVLKDVLEIVLNEQSAIRREQMITEIANATGIRHSVIEHEIEIRENFKSRKINERIQSVIYDAMNEAKYNPSEAEGILIEASQTIKRIQESFGINTVTSNSITDRVLDWNKKILEIGGGNTLQWGKFDSINKVLDADITDGYVLSIGGHPNTGKSAILISLIAELLNNNDDLAILFATIDDSFERVLPRMIKAFSYDPYNITTIRDIRNIKYIPESRLKDHIQNIRTSGLNKIINLIQQNRLLIYDRSNGDTLPYLTSMVKKFRQENPSKKIIVFLDNFHKLDPISSVDNKIRVSYRKMSSDIKGMAETLHVGVMMSIEYNKVDSSVEPKNNDVGETGKLLYDSTAIFHLINELDGLKEEATLFHYDTMPSDPFSEREISKLPTIRLRVGKSKDNFFKGNLFYDFYPSRGDFEEVDYRTIKERRAMAQTGVIPKTIDEKRQNFINKKKNLTS